MLVVTGEIFGCGDINTTKDFKLSHFGDLAGQQSNSGGARDRGLCHLHPFELYPETHPFALLFGGGLIDYPRGKGISTIKIPIIDRIDFGDYQAKNEQETGW